MAAIEVTYSLPPRPLNLLHATRYFAGECKMLGTRSSTPHVVSFETMVFIIVRLFSRLFINFAVYVNVYYFHVFTFSIA